MAEGRYGPPGEFSLPTEAEACPAALGSSLDLQAAQFLLSTPPAYQTALIPHG